MSDDLTRQILCVAECVVLIRGESVSEERILGILSGTAEAVFPQMDRFLLQAVVVLEHHLLEDLIDPCRAGIRLATYCGQVHCLHRVIAEAHLELTGLLLQLIDGLCISFCRWLDELLDLIE